MGSRLGKFVYYSYNMSDRSEKKEDKHCEVSSCSNGACSNSDANVSNLQKDKEQQSDDQSDGKSSTGSGETTCVSWRTRSDNWSMKKRRTFKSGSSSKKEFFGKRNKKWPMRKSKGESSDVEPPPTGSLSCVCTMYRRMNSESEQPTPGSSSSALTSNNNDTIQRLFATTSAAASTTANSKRNMKIYYEI